MNGNMPSYEIDADSWDLDGSYEIQQTIQLHRASGPYTTISNIFFLDLVDPCKTATFNAHPDFSNTFPGTNKITTSVKFGTDHITSATYPSDTSV